MMSKPLPIFPQMPWHIKTKIVKSADTNTKFTLRRSSKELKVMVDKSRVSYSRLYLDWSYRGTISIDRDIALGDKNDYTVFFKPNYLRNKYSGFCKGIRYSRRAGRLDDTIEDFDKGSHMDAAVHQFMKLFQNPNSHIKYLAFRFGPFENKPEFEAEKEELLGKTLKAMSNLNFTIQVDTINVINNRKPADTLRILPFLRLETFKEISFIHQAGNTVDMDLTEISQTEHWKQARELVLGNYYMTLPRETIEHFSRASYSSRTFDVEDAKYIIQNILRPNGWKSRYIRCDHYDYESMVRYLSKLPNLRKFKTDDGMMFEMRKEEFKCRVVLSRGHANSVSFCDASKRVLFNRREVSVWLGANVMVEYPLEEAKKMLEKNRNSVQTVVDELTAELAFIKDQITTTEVNLSHIVNYGVNKRRAAAGM